jgi:cell division protein FtsZ
LLEDTRIAGSRAILINITGSTAGLGLHEVNEACSLIRDAAECDDAQINFGVIQNDSMGDAVKITVIATGFQPEFQPVVERRVSSGITPVIRLNVPLPEPAPAAPEPAPMAALELEPEPAFETEPEGETEPILDLNDLDTPAYLRQGRLLN